jgi:glycosyltransferase involved in cell wall biosynthesis
MMAAARGAWPPLVSIIVPAFNAAPWLEETLRSCVAQTYPEIEVIVVDDGSTDNTGAVAERFASAPGSHVQVVRRPHAGLGAARNVGVRHSRGEYLYFLDADDLVEPDAVRSAIQLIAATGAEAVVGDWYDFIDNAAEPTHYHAAPFAYPEDPVASLLLHPLVVSAYLILRTDTLWDERLISWEGPRYFMEVLPRLTRIEHLPQPMVRVRQRQDAERLTIKHDHFEPACALSFYADLKRRLARRGDLTARREEALDSQLLAYAYTARRRGITDLRTGCSNINSGRLREYAWHKPLGLSGFAALFGARCGVELFYRINHTLKRA